MTKTTTKALWLAGVLIGLCVALGACNATPINVPLGDGGGRDTFIGDVGNAGDVNGPDAPADGGPMLRDGASDAAGDGAGDGGDAGDAGDGGGDAADAGDGGGDAGDGGVGDAGDGGDLTTGDTVVSETGANDASAG